MFIKGQEQHKYVDLRIFSRFQHEKLRPDEQNQHIWGFNTAVSQLRASQLYILCEHPPIFNSSSSN